MKYGSEEFWEAYEERAAIMEFDAYDVYPDRKSAERAAFKDTVDQCET